MLENDLKEELYQKSVEEETRGVAKTLPLLAVILFPLFTVLDYISQREKYALLSLIRFSTTFFYLGAYIAIKRGIGLQRPTRTCLFLILVGAISITLMCMVLQGADSPYYAGVNLVILACVLLLPLTWIQMLKTVLVIIFLYVLGVLSVEKFEYPDSLGLFINNLFFLCATATIGITASALKDQLRKKSFFQNLEIKRSIQLLQSDLKGQENNIEQLAQQMVEKKAEVINALATRDGFISIASHELRTPLTSMKLQLDIALFKLKNEEAKKEDLQHHINSANNGIQRIVKLVDEMLDVSRIQSGKFVIEKKDMELNEVVQTIMSRHYIDHVSSGRISYQLFDGILRGSWDLFKIEQVILNLINNALRYGAGSSIYVETGLKGEYCFLSVKDSGPGIPLEEQTKIFEKFESGKSSSHKGGLGLGLFISKEIIRAHQGKIEVESEPGKGSCFTIYLPLLLEKEKL